MGNLQRNFINIDNLSIKKQLKFHICNIILLNDERLVISSYNQGLAICKQNFNKEEDFDIIISETKDSSNLFLLSNNKLIAYLNTFFIIEILPNNNYKIIFEKNFSLEIRKVIEISNNKIILLFSNYLCVASYNNINYHFQIELMINTGFFGIDNKFSCFITEEKNEKYLIHGNYNKIIFYSINDFQIIKNRELPKNYILHGLFFLLNKQYLIYLISNFKKEKEIIFLDIKTNEIKEKIQFVSQLISAHLILNDNSFLLSYIKNNNTHFKIYNNKKFHKEKNIKIKEIFKCILYSKINKRLICLSDNFLYYLE